MVSHGHQDPFDCSCFLIFHFVIDYRILAKGREYPSGRVVEENRLEYSSEKLFLQFFQRIDHHQETKFIVQYGNTNALLRNQSGGEA